MKKRIHKFFVSVVRAFFLLLFAAIIFGIAIYGAQAYPKVFSVEVELAKNKMLKSDEAVTVNFSQAMISSWKDMKVEIYPQEKISLNWSTNKRQLQIIPLEFWKPETEYEIRISNGKSIMLTSLNESLNFETKKYPSVEKFYPLEGEKNVTIGIEDPILVSFDDSLADFNVKLVFNPSSELVYDLTDDMRKIRLVPKNSMEEGKRYDVDVFIKYKKESAAAYHKIFSSYFETKQKALPAEMWDKDPNVKLEQAKQYTAAQILTGKYVDVNLKQQVVVRFENGKALDANLISSGKPGMETPTGTFEIHNKFPRVWSKKYSLFMPYWMALVGSGEFGFHELPEWPGGYKEGANHLGRPVSHGCVRLGVGPAKILYDWVEIGTPVIIHY